MDPRQQRGLMMAALCKITQKKEGLWTVPSQSGTGQYWVRVEPEQITCTCPDYEKRQQKCKHVFAVEYVIQRETNGDGIATTTEAVKATETVTRTDLATGAVTETLTEAMLVKQTVAPKRTYKQDWPAYNLAQTQEKHQFQTILADLCRGIEEPPQEKGRPRASLRDMVFSAVFKVYSTVSGRRFQCDLNDACERGHIEKAPHYNTVFKYLEMPGLTPILKRLIAESSLPLKSVEQDFAIDSSGFATSRFVRWFDHKYGQPKQEYDWVKCHLVCGVKTNVVAAVQIDERHAADAPQFVPLLKATAENFTIREVSADAIYSTYENYNEVTDAAYLSYENVELVGQAGGVPFILPKDNTTAAKGGLFEKMFHYFMLRRDEFLSHYHKRSNVETTFSMIKAKFGDSLRSKTDTAMINEALAKILCHNICCLIQSHYELGIVPVFWEDESTESPALPAPVVQVDPVEAWAWV
jgi:transposase